MSSTYETKSTTKEQEQQEQEHQEHVRVGVGVLVKNHTRHDQIYCGIRRLKSSDGVGTLALPGGHLERMEEWEDCAKREIQEEMGITIHNVQFAHVANTIFMELATADDDEQQQQYHYVTIYMTSHTTDVPKNMEPHKCEGWKPYTWNELKDIHKEDPQKLFGPLAKLVEDEPQAILDFMESTLQE